MIREVKFGGRTVCQKLQILKIQGVKFCSLRIGVAASAVAFGIFLQVDVELLRLFVNTDL